MSEYCDLKDVLTPEDRKGKNIVYGKRMLVSHRNYDLWDEESDKFNEKKIETFYKLFVYNMYILKDIFEPRWVYTHELLTTSKGLIWDWTSEEEKQRNAEDIDKNGVYFPILTLDRGLLHNQIMNEEEQKKLSAKMLYNSYNGNHRMDCMQYLVEKGIWDKDKKVLIFIVPPYCQKSCTGFKYTPIDDTKENDLTQQKLDKPINLIHLDYVEHEMKVTNWRKKVDLDDGLSLVMVDNYNVAFRIMLELQNVLEPVLVRYYQLYRKLPNQIVELSKVFNIEESFNDLFRL